MACPTICGVVQSKVGLFGQGFLREGARGTLRPDVGAKSLQRGVADGHPPIIAIWRL